MTRSYQPTEIPACPHCEATLDGQAQDYIIPGRGPGKPSRGEDECPECGEQFVAELEPAGTIKFS